MGDHSRRKFLGISNKHARVIVLSGLLVVILWGGVFFFALQNRSENLSTGLQVVTTPTPSLPKHTLANVAYDPEDFYPAESKIRKPLLWVVIDDWKNFTGADAWQLGEYYLAQYSQANPIEVDFLCDSKYASTETYLATPVDEYYSHMLFSYVGPWKATLREWDKPAEVITSKAFPKFGTACK